MFERQKSNLQCAFSDNFWFFFSSFQLLEVNGTNFENITATEVNEI